MLPAGADFYLRVNDVAALRRAFTPEALRQLGRLDVGVVAAEYGGDKVLVASQRGAAIPRPDTPPLRETPAGGVVHERWPGQAVVAYPKHGAVLTCSMDRVDAIDAVVGGQAPALGNDDVFSSGRLATDHAAYGFTHGKLGSRSGAGPETTITFALETEPRARVLARAEVPGLDGEGVGPLLERIPPDTVAFEAHAFPAAMPLELEKLYRRWAPGGRGILEEALGVKLSAVPDLLGRRAMVAVVVPEGRRDQPLIELLSYGAVVGVMTPVEAAERDAFVAGWRSQMVERWGAEALREEAGRLEVQTDGHWLWVVADGDALWVGAGAKDVVRAPEGPADVPVKGLDDVSAALWIDAEWAAVPEKLVDHLLVRPGTGEQVTTLRIDDGEATLSVDLGMLETMVGLAMEAFAEQIADALQQGMFEPKSGSSWPP